MSSTNREEFALVAQDITLQWSGNYPAWVVYAFLRMKQKNGIAWPSIAQIARGSGMDPRTARKAIEILVNCGLVSKIPPSPGKGASYRVVEGAGEVFKVYGTVLARRDMSPREKQMHTVIQSHSRQNSDHRKAATTASELAGMSESQAFNVMAKLKKKVALNVTRGWNTPDGEYRPGARERAAWRIAHEPRTEDGGRKPRGRPFAPKADVTQADDDYFGVPSRAAN